MKCWYHCRTDITFDDGVIGKTGKKIPLNLDGTRHDCPNSSYNKRFSRSNSVPPQENNRPEPIVTIAGVLFDDKNIENARWFIDGLNLRLVRKRIELVVKEKEVQH